MHREAFIMHRDLKTRNLLYSNDGLLKVCDFGLARLFQNSSVKQQYTNWVVTLWYRAPELLFGCDTYSEKVDMWSVGCIMAELILREPLICGKSEIDQLERMFKIVGTPNDERWPGWRELKYAKKYS
jgi:cell division cycle 2-like protein